MANLVLYRKYRPKSFSEMTGQEHVIQTLSNAIKNGNISHAYLFSGPRGCGKTTLARIFAKAINCQNRKGSEPCNECPSCLGINEGKAIDIIEIDAASHRGIDEIRELKDGIRFAPASLKYKVFIIDESHQLTKEAANALLKTLEEPPSHAIFILATTEAHKMIPTIASRCQRFDFRKLTIPEIVKRLEWIAKKENIKIEKAALELIALNSDGSSRDADGILDQALTFCKTVSPKEEIKTDDLKSLLGIVDINLAAQFMDYLTQKKTKEAIDFLNETFEKGKDPYEFNRALIGYLRRGLLLKISGTEIQQDMSITGLSKEECEKLKSQVINLKEKDILQVIKLFLEAENKMKYSSIPQLPLELATIEALKSEEK